MKLLILSNYFTPDLSAGAFRMQSLVEALSAYRKDGLEVDLITTRPNRYASMKITAPTFEDHGWIRIHRIELPAHKSGMSDQAKAYLAYVMGVHKRVERGHWDLVFATSSRLMTAGLGAYVARHVKAPLYLDIRDLFTDNMKELLVGSPLKLLMPVFYAIERATFRSAERINIVSEGFRGNVAQLAPQVTPSVYTNGIDRLFLDTDFQNPPAPDGLLPLILYAGNMGEGQGLHRVVPEAAKRLEGKARFRLIGDGGRRRALEEAMAAAKVENVDLLPPVPRTDLLAHYREASILFLHLNDLDAFRKVLPSKIFEYGATGKPMLAGVKGYSAQFLVEQLPSTEVFAPLDVDAMVAAIERLIQRPSTFDNSNFCDAFSRSVVMANMAKDIVALVCGVNRA